MESDGGMALFWTQPSPPSMLQEASVGTSSNAPARATMRLPTSGSRRLDGAEELLELVGGVADAVGELVDDVERTLVLADLQQFVDEILAGLQLAQELGEVLARALELADRAFSRGLGLAPAVDREPLVF